MTVNYAHRPMELGSPAAPICFSPKLTESLESVVLPIDKPEGISSFDVLRRLKRVMGKRKMGHAGTLDPMATGLLICLIGRATKMMRHYLEMPKVYTGRIRLGETTPSFDADTPVLARMDATHISDEQIRAAASGFTGSIRQSTPIYSAVKVGGERLYKKARRGEQIRTPSRDVSIYSFDTKEKSGAEFDFTLHCSKGTYVRAVANDMGEALGVGAHLIALRRIRIGEIDVADAWDLNELSYAVEHIHQSEA